MAFLTGSKVPLLEELRGPLRQIGAGRRNSLKSSIGGISERQAASSRASGRVLGEYAPAALSEAGTQAYGGIEDALLGALGGASLDEVQKRKEHEDNLALVQQIGDLNSPSTLEEVLMGLSGGAKAGGQAASLYQALGKGGGGGYSKNPAYGLSSASNYGLNYPKIPDFGTPRRTSYGF